MKKLSIIVLVMAMVPAMSSLVFAQDDDYGDFDAAGDFLYPNALSANETYDFNFLVENTSDTINQSNNWICEVDIFMPSDDYELDEDFIADPDALHSGEWVGEIDYDADNSAAITWMHSGLNASSSMVCDIHEGEGLEFAFRATTDTGPRDGFEWRALSAGGDWVTGTAYVGAGADDDDDNADDDADIDDDTDEWPTAADDDEDADDDSDSTSFSCGC